MPNPIIIIFEYHQVPAGEHLLQYNFSALVEEGYRTYLDEEASGTDLKSKQNKDEARNPELNANIFPYGSRLNVVKRYQTEQKAEKAKLNDSSNKSGFFAGVSEEKPQITSADTLTQLYEKI